MIEHGIQQEFKPLLNISNSLLSLIQNNGTNPKIRVRAIQLFSKITTDDHKNFWLNIIDSSNNEKIQFHSVQALKKIKSITNKDIIPLLNNFSSLPIKKALFQILINIYKLNNKDDFLFNYFRKEMYEIPNETPEIIEYKSELIRSFIELKDIKVINCLFELMSKDNYKFYNYQVNALKIFENFIHPYSLQKLCEVYQIAKDDKLRELVLISLNNMYDKVYERKKKFEEEIIKRKTLENVIKNQMKNKLPFNDIKNN